jgi:hypothetical protein
VGEIAQLLTAIATLIVAVGGVVIGLRNSTHIKKVEAATNGMKNDLVDEVRKASFAAGEKSEKDKSQT